MSTEKTEEETKNANNAFNDLSNEQHPQSKEIRAVVTIIKPQYLKGGELSDKVRRLTLAVKNKDGYKIENNIVCIAPIGRAKEGSVIITTAYKGCYKKYYKDNMGNTAYVFEQGDPDKFYCDNIEVVAQLWSQKVMELVLESI